MTPRDADTENRSDRIDRDTGRGLAHELVEKLKEQILAGKMVPGQKLPTEA
ncbi:MAG: GntR family transcriptional regulator, partial [Dermatophilaceae bacterium]|nr:GntR family transcriptional regulator [Dermatophilaceae bacterium]